MDSKKVIEQLVKIAASQQKIINKLAQQLQPQSFDAAKPELHAAQAVLAVLPANVKALVTSMDAVGDELRTSFKPGATQATVSSIQHVVDSLVQQNKLPFPMKVTPV